MYVSRAQLNFYNPYEEKEVKDRWDCLESYDIKNYVTELIKKGAGENFLQRSVEYGPLKGFLRDEWDLRGFTLHSESIQFPSRDNFKGIDFSYSHFYHCTFENAYFRCSFGFARFYNCKFIECTFHISGWLGNIFENCTFQNVDFIEYCSFTNCEFINTSLESYFTSNLLFKDCKFNSSCFFDEPRLLPNSNVKMTFTQKLLGDFYISLAEGFKTGGVYDTARNYYYKSRCSRTRFNNNGINKIFNFILEIIAGYGYKPLRPLYTSIFTIIIFSIINLIKVDDFYKSFIYSSSAFIAIGDTTSIPFPLDILYLVEGFLGFILLGLYLSVLINVWFFEK